MARQPLKFTAPEPGTRPEKPWHRDAFIDASHRIARLGYCEWDYTNGCIISCSPYYAEIFGMSIPEVIESQSTWDRVLQQIHPDDRARYAQSHEEILGQGTHEIEYRAYRKDGEICHLKEVGIVFFDDNGEPVESMGMLQDITEQKTRIQDLENRDEMARQVESMTDIGHFIWDTDVETFRYLSPGYLRILGADIDAYQERIGSLDAYIAEIHEQDRAGVIEAYAEQCKYDTDVVLEYRVSHPDGNFRWIRESSVIAVDSTSGSKQAIGIIQNITEQKMIEQSLLDSKSILEAEVAARTQKLSETVERLNREIAEREIMSSELEVKNAELERFTYTVSHDLKSPLVTIKGFLGLLEKDIAADDGERVADDIEKLKHATDTMGALLDDLLELSRVGRVIGEPAVCELSAITARAIELLRPDLDARGVEIVVGELPRVTGDDSRLAEVFVNLIENAAKFMGDGASPRIEIAAEPADDMVRCTVRDNGIGIEAEYQQQIFELFERLDVSVDGTGVGLALAKRIVEVHGGQIWVESGGRGKGTAIHFTLPPA